MVQYQLIPNPTCSESEGNDNALSDDRNVSEVEAERTVSSALSDANSSMLTEYDRTSDDSLV